MSRIVCDPSSGSTELCLTEITCGGSQIFFVCLVCVWKCNFEPAVCVHGTTGVPSLLCHAHTLQVQNYTAKHWPSTRKISVSHHEKFQSSTAQYSLMMDRTWSRTCWSDF